MSGPMLRAIDALFQLDQKPWYVSPRRWEQEHALLRWKLSESGGAILDLIDYLGGRMSVIDAKVGVLLTFNTLFPVVASICVSLLLPVRWEKSLQSLPLPGAIWFSGACW